MRNWNLQKQYEAFDAANPQVYAKLVEITAFVVAAGKTRYGIAAIFERLRWILEFETDGNPYKLNNNYRAFYVRRLVAEHPEFASIFELRRSVADGTGISDEDEDTDDEPAADDVVVTM